MAANRPLVMAHESVHPYGLTGPPKRRIYSVEVPGTETVTSGPIRRHPHPVGPQLAYEGCYTIYELFRHVVAHHGDRPFLGHRPLDDRGNPGPYVFETYDDVARRVDDLASGLQQEDLLPPTSDGLRLLGVYMKNNPEWVIADQAAFTCHGTTVPLYDTLGPESVSYVINQTELHTVVCGPLELENLVAAAQHCPSLKAVIVVIPGDRGLNDHLRHLARKGGLKLYNFTDLERVGARHPHPPHPPNPDDIATFSYTSGTTGGPKGALISHQNLISVFCSSNSMNVVQADNEVHLSYMPLPHVYERFIGILVMGRGGAIGFWQGSPEKLFDDMKALEPTVLPMVPRILNRVHDKILQGVNAGPKLNKALFHKAYEAKLSALRANRLSRGLWDKLVFSKMRTALGWRRLKVMVSGSAPLAPHVLDFMRVLCACPVYEGYGQTETAAVTTVGFPNDWTTGHVGGVAPVSEIKLVDVPEMGYLHTDRVHGARTSQGGKQIACVGRGEVCVRGPHVFKGYYKMPEKTAETVDADGWLYSGDVGMWDMDGRLYIIDRKKNIFKLSQGEYVAAEKIENVIQQSLLIAQSFVYGDSLKSELVAIIVPDPTEVGLWMKTHGLSPSTPLQELCRNEMFNDAIMQEVKTCAKRAGLHGFEIPKAVYLESEPFSPQNELLTPTQKLRRVEARERYLSVIEDLYAKLASDREAAISTSSTSHSRL